MDDTVWDTAVLKLAEALTHILACRPPLSAATENALLQAKEAIDTVGADPSRKGRPGAAGLDRGDIGGPKKHSPPHANAMPVNEIGVNSSMGDRRKITGSESSYSSATAAEAKDSRAVNTGCDILLTASHPMTAALYTLNSRNISKNRGKVSPIRPLIDVSSIAALQRERLLIALSPLWKLTEAESNKTVMETIFGSRAVALFWGLKELLRTLSIVTGLGAFAFLILVFSLPATTDSSTLLVVSTIYAFCNLYLAIYFIWLMNSNLALRTLKNFDAVYFLLEALFYSMSLWAVFCFEDYALLFSLAWFVGSACFLMYDSFPVTIRQRLSFAYVIFFATHMFMISMLYARVSPRICTYRLHFVNGISERGKTCEVAADTRFSISLLDFCLNRALTIALLSLRITQTVVKHPQDCVTLKSRMRLIETFSSTTTSGETNSASSAVANSQSQSTASRNEPMLALALNSRISDDSRSQPMKRGTSNDYG